MQNDDDPFHHDIPFFRARLAPHRSLGRGGLVVTMVLVGAVSFAAGLLFWSIGAWPVAGFLGLDVALIYLAFRLNARAARVIEEVSVSATEIHISRTAANGRSQSWRVNPFFARVLAERDEERGIERLTLSTREVSVDLGSFLPPAERTRFGRALSAAVAQARRGGVTANEA